MIAPDGHVGHVAPRNTGFLRELGFGAVLVEPHHGKPAVARHSRRVVHGDEAIRVAGIAHHQHANIGSRILFDRAALSDKDFPVDAEEFLALHARLARHTADEQGPVDAVESAVEIARGLDALQKREGTILQFHGHTLEGGHAGLDLDQLERNGLVGPEDLAAGDAGKNGIADLAGRAGHGNTDCFFHRDDCAGDAGRTRQKTNAQK